MFQNRKLLIATKHHKENVIAPILRKELGVICCIDTTFDTDTLGTFTGEVDRKLDPISTAREKCLKAMEGNDCELGIASEGSFGPHPSLFFVNADDEFLIFIDKKNNLEIIVRELSTETNFNGKELKNEHELIEFANSIGFPSHGLILRKAKDDVSEIHKGITDLVFLKTAFNHLHAQFQSVYAETDMRGMYNPTRMKVIQKATLKLVEKIKSTCPECQTPGFGIAEVKKGLQCSLCGSPTHSTLSYVYQCLHCKYTKEYLYPNNKKTEDPMYCNYCNP
jgi:hypothetical protein